VDSVLGKSCIEISDTDAICGRIVSLESTQLVPANDIQTGRNKLDRCVEIVDIIGILHINDVPLIPYQACNECKPARSWATWAHSTTNGGESGPVHVGAQDNNTRKDVCY